VPNPSVNQYAPRETAGPGPALTIEARAVKAVGRTFPGPVGLAAWIAVTVPVPLMFYEATHRWEEDQNVSAAMWWVVGALPVLAATVAARWTERTGRRRAVRAGLAAMAAGTLVGAVFLAGSMAFYRWVIPLRGAMIWSAVLWSGLLLAVAGGAIGYVVGLKGWRRRRWSARQGYLLGAVVAVLGALLAPVTVRLGAEDSTSRYDEGQYGGVGPDVAAAGGSGVVLPAAGRYAILAMGDAPGDPDCRVSGSGLAERRAELVTIPPSDYGGDFATYAWVASFTVPGPGTYSLTCRTGEERANYTVGAVPEIRGAVGALIHWPLVVIWLLGSLPGLLIIVSAVGRRARRAEAPVPA
jgi:hypothetical protein